MPHLKNVLAPTALLLVGLMLPAAHAQRHSASPAAAAWTGTWGAAPMESKLPGGEIGADGITLRETAHVSLGGNELRVVLTNEFGTEDLKVAAAQIALPAADGGVVAGSSQALTFNGKPSVVIPAGANMVSDSVAFRLAPLSNVTVSLFLPQQTITTATAHNFADTTNYMSVGNGVSATTMTEAKPFYSWLFFKGIDVQANDASIVAFGDSITDGAQSTRDRNARWPDVLAARLAANGATKNVGVLNMGIGGNRLLHDKTGPNALARLDRDVLAQSGVKYVIVLEAINDIGHAYAPKNPGDMVTADDVIGAYVQIIERCHEHGIKVYGATLTPYVGAGYQSEQGEQVRQAVNQWIRTSGRFDAVIDFDKTTRDPANPGEFKPGYNGDGTRADHLHPNDVGYKAIGDSIDLGLFTR